VGVGVGVGLGVGLGTGVGVCGVDVADGLTSVGVGFTVGVTFDALVGVLVGTPVVAVEVGVDVASSPPPHAAMIDTAIVRSKPMTMVRGFLLEDFNPTSLSRCHPNQT